MTILDHSSAASLLADLDRHRNSLFRFDYAKCRRFTKAYSSPATSSPNPIACDGIVTSQMWRLRSASLETVSTISGIRIRIEYGKKTTDAPFFCLVRGRLMLGRAEFGIVVVEGHRRFGPPQGGPSGSNADDRLQEQLDDNLRGAFV